MLSFRRSIVAGLVLTVCGLVVCSSALAAKKRNVIRRLSLIKTAEVVPLFDGLDTGQLTANVSIKNEKFSTVYVHNQTDQPLTVDIPAAVGAVHVLKQVFQPDQNNGNSNGNGSANSGQGQNVGGQLSGFGNNSGGNSIFGGSGNGQNGNAQNGNNLFGGGMGAGLFSIPPEATVALKLDSVCLAHGRKDPTPAMKYQLRPIQKVVNDRAVIALLQSFDRATKNRKAVQAAAWHLANDISWLQLKAKQVRVLGHPVAAWFSKRDLAGAQLMARNAKLPAKSPAKTPTGNTRGFAMK